MTEEIWVAGMMGGEEGTSSEEGTWRGRDLYAEPSFEETRGMMTWGP
jgi:hypothetical protein